MRLGVATELTLTAALFVAATADAGATQLAEPVQPCLGRRGAGWLQHPSGSLLSGFLRPTVEAEEEDQEASAQELQQPATPLLQRLLSAVSSWSVGAIAGAATELLLKRRVSEVEESDQRKEDVDEADSPSQHEVRRTHVPWKMRKAFPLLLAFLAGLLAQRSSQLVRSSLGSCTERLRMNLLRLRGQGGGLIPKIPLHGVLVLPTGKGKAPPPKAKGPGPPPGKGKAPPPGKAGAKALAIQLGDDKGGGSEPETPPFGKRIHWVQPDYNEPGGDTIFGKLKAAEGPQFDQKLLTTIFAGDFERSKRRSWAASRPLGKSVLDTQRAQGAAIMVNRLKMSAEDLRSCINSLCWDDPRLLMDDIEILGMAMPTPDESAKLLAVKPEFDQLRDIERKLMPLCEISPSRLRLVKFGLSHSTLHASMLARCRVIGIAAQEARKSTQFLEFLRLSLQVGNFINHGEAEMRQGMVRAFALESLRMLSSCKAGPVSALHFVCLTLRSEDPGFMQSLRASLLHVREASREKVSSLEADIVSFGKEVQFVRQQEAIRSAKEQEQQQEGGERSAACLRLERLANDAAREEAELRTELKQALAGVSDAQQYFNVSVKRGSNPPTPEQFFGQISSTLDNLQSAWREVENHGRRWQRQFEGGAEGGEGGARPPRIKARTRSSLDGSPCSDAHSSSASSVAGKQADADAMDSDSSTGGTAEGGAPTTRKSSPAILRPTVGLQQRTKRPLKSGIIRRRAPDEGGSSGSGASNPQLSPRAVVQTKPKVCEFHAMHDSETEQSDNGQSTRMKRGSTSFPDICEFHLGSPKKDERTWDFEISGTSAYAMALWRRRRKQGQKDDTPYARQNTL